MPDPYWYALWTRSRHEAAVRQELKRIQVETFLPIITRWSRWKDRKKKIAWPLFPGHCSARFGLGSRFTVLNCPGVINIVSFNAEAAPIPDVEIESIRQLIESELQCDPCPMIKKRTLVEVVHGPLKGVIGRLERKDHRARLVLSVDLINQAVSVTVDAANVKPY